MIQHVKCRTPVIVITDVRVAITNLGFNEGASLVATMCDLTTDKGQPITSRNIKSIKIDKLWCPSCNVLVPISEINESCACGGTHPISELHYFGNPLFVISKLECIQKCVVYGNLDERLLKMIDSFSLEEVFTDKLGAITGLFRS